MSHKRAVNHVNISEPRTLRQLLRRLCRACSMNSWRFPLSSRMGMEQLPSPIKDAIVLIDPTPHFVSYVTTFVKILSLALFILLSCCLLPTLRLPCWFYFITFLTFSLLLLCYSSQILPYVSSPITFVSGIFIIKWILRIGTYDGKVILFPISLFKFLPL